MQDLHLSTTFQNITHLTWTPFKFQSLFLQQYLEGVSTWGSMLNNMGKNVQ